MVVASVFVRQSSLLRHFPTLLSRAMVKNPSILATTLSTTGAKPMAFQNRSPPEIERNLLIGNKVTAMAIRGTATEVKEIPPSAARRYYLERVWMVGMLPLFPAALFIHNPFIDYALATAVALHIHWGMEAVVEDYARPFVIGETLAKLSHYGIYIFSLLMYIGLLHFNYADVGITKAFEMIWSL